MTDEAILRRQYDELAADNGRLLNRLAVAEAQTAEVDRALIACQEEIADLKQRIRDERREHEHTKLNRAGASAQADGLAKALIACQERCNRLAEALWRIVEQAELIDNDAAPVALDLLITVEDIARAALAEHDAAHERRLVGG